MKRLYIQLKKGINTRRKTEKNGKKLDVKAWSKLQSWDTKKIESAAVTDTTDGAMTQRMRKQKSQLRPMDDTYAFTLPGIKIVKLF